MRGVTLRSALFARLHRLAGRLPRQFQPVLTAQQQAALGSGGDHLRQDGANDGMVPVLSQVWGRVLGVYTADHLDIIGFFEQPGFTPPHRDWLFSGTSFQRRDFEEMCAVITAFFLKHMQEPVPTA